MANQKTNQRRSNRNKKRNQDFDSNPKSVAGCSLPHVVTDSKASNDPSWYTHIYPLPKDVASLSFNIPAGQMFNATIDANVNYPDNWDGVEFSWNKIAGLPQYGFKSVPGVMVLDVLPTLGKCADPHDAANIAAQQEYTLVRKANSGAINYDKTDLMMLNIAMDSAYMLYEYLLRAYRTFGMYATMNRYMPDTLLRAMGFDPALSTDLANFKTTLDLFAYDMGSVNMPDQFDFIKRHSWLFTHVYKDSQLDKASMYLFKPTGFYVWTEGEENKPTYLKYTKVDALFGTMGSNISSIDQIRNAIDTIMKPILGSQDVGTISGDVAKAFGEGGMIKLRAVEEHEELVPVYDMEVISQIENARIFSTPSMLDITQQLNDTIAGPYLEQNILLNDEDVVKKFIKPLLNMHMESPTPEDVMVATRFIADVGDPVVVGLGAGNISGFTLGSSGTEIITGCTVYMHSTHPTNPRQIALKSIDVRQEVPVGDIADSPGMINASKAYDLATLATVISAFDHHPTIYLIGAQTLQSKAVSVPGTFAGTIQDYDNYLWLEPDTVGNLNNTAVLSEFAVKDYPMF